MSMLDIFRNDTSPITNSLSEHLKRLPIDGGWELRRERKMFTKDTMGYKCRWSKYKDGKSMSMSATGSTAEEAVLNLLKEMNL